VRLLEINKMNRTKKIYSSISSNRPYSIERTFVLVGFNNMRGTVEILDVPVTSEKDFELINKYCIGDFVPRIRRGVWDFYYRSPHRVLDST